MNKPGRDAGGAVIAVAIVLIMLIMLMAGGGLFMLASGRRAAVQEVTARALLAEQQAVLETQRLLAEQQVNAARQELDRARVVAAEARRAEQVTAANSDEPIAANNRLGRLAWLVNHWQRTEGQGSSEEHWIAPRGGLMLGLNRSVDGAGKTSFEYLRIELTEDDQLAYYASPQGGQATRFSLKEMDDERVMFENQAHDFPQRISYWRDEQRRLHARIEGRLEGKLREIEWTWSAVR